MKSILILNTLIISTLIAGCMNFPKMPPPKPVSCDKDSSFEKGMNDGMSRRAMSSEFLNVCNSADLKSLKESYKEGYLKGVKVVPAASPRPYDDTYGGPRPGVNIEIGSTHSKAWFCKVQAFTKTYKGFGRTEQEAKYQAQQKCELDHHSMHCDDTNCVGNN